MENQKGLCWQYVTRTQGVQCLTGSQIQFLPDNYPHPVPFKSVVDGCTMPAGNPDLPWLIRRHRKDHVAFWESRRDMGPHRIEEVEDQLIAPGRRDVLLIGAGWSAGENMALVRRWIGIKNPIVIAVNRAAVCWPDADVFFITERQANPYWWRHANPDAVCLTAPSVNPAILEHFKPFQYAYFGTPWCWYDKWVDAPDWALKPPLLCLPACETTMSMALAWTVRLKPLRVIMLGVDHCWPAYTANYDNVWLPGPYYCDGYPWNGPPEMNRYVRRGINGRVCVCNEINERQVRIFKRGCEQIQVNNCLPEPVSVINGSGHGILDFNEDNLLFMRECDESVESENQAESETMMKERTLQGGPAASVAVMAYSEPLCPAGSYGAMAASGMSPESMLSYKVPPSEVPVPEPKGITVTRLEPCAVDGVAPLGKMDNSGGHESASHPPLSTGAFHSRGSVG